MPNRRALAGAVFIAIAALLGTQRASAGCEGWISTL